MRDTNEGQQKVPLLDLLDLSLLDRVIAAIELAPPETIMMEESITELACGRTAYCIGGWARALAGQSLASRPLDAAQSSPGIFRVLNPSGDQELDRCLEDLFHMRQLETAGYQPLEDFDSLEAQLRKDIVLAVLRKFKATGKVDWMGLAAPHMSPLAMGIAHLYPPPTFDVESK